MNKTELNFMKMNPTST